jgi:cycloartenol synthase
VHHEDETTHYLDIGPVSKAINLLCCWLEDPQGEAYKKHLPRIFDYLWVAEDGLKMKGYNGPSLWETAFAAQALAAAAEGGGSRPSAALRGAHRFVSACQIDVELPAASTSRFYRQRVLGSWPFSTRDSVWPISDCCAEGLKAALCLRGLGEAAAGPAVDPRLLDECVARILEYQNGTGGWATYENRRTFPALEALNPAEVFEGIIGESDTSCATISIRGAIFFLFFLEQVIYIVVYFSLIAVVSSA